MLRPDARTASNGNDIERKAERSFDLGFIFDIEAKQTCLFQNLYSKDRSEANPVYSTNWKDRSEAKSVHSTISKIEAEKHKP